MDNNIPDQLIVTIEKLSNLGMGIAKRDGFVIFIPETCPGDIARVKIYKKNKSFAFAKVEEIITPSNKRNTPFCPMQKVCGACQLQFIDYNYQLEFKKQIVIDTMHSIGNKDILVKDVIPSPKIKEYRHKIQYPVSETLKSKRILAGYYKQDSHEIVNIKYCPIQPIYCDKIIEFIRDKAKECNVSGYIEKTHKGELRHIVIRTSEYSKKSLITLVINSSKITENIKKLAELIYNNNDNIAGVCVNLNPKKTNVILSNNTILLNGISYVEEKLCDKVFKIGSNSFFQVNPLSANNIFEYIKKYISENFTKPNILDAYAGIATFGICLSDIASQVTSVESNEQAVELAKNIIKENNITNLNVFCQDTAMFCKTKLNKFDITVLDPPRKGCSKESLDLALNLTKNKIIYVSCNPATLARDLKYLIEKGANVEYIQPFDMFPHTYHIENVAIINLNNVH